MSPKRHVLAGPSLFAEMARYPLPEAGGLADVKHIAVRAEKTVHPRLIGQRTTALLRHGVRPLAGCQRFARRGQPSSELGPRLYAPRRELRRELAPDERRRAHVTQAPSLQMQPMPQKPCQGAQISSRQIRIEPAGNRVHAHRVDWKRGLWLKALRPIAQERQLEASKVNRCAQLRSRGQASAKSSPRLLRSQRVDEHGFVKPS